MHDVIEDRQFNYNDIKQISNERTADIVFDVSDELGKNRKERKSKTWPKLDKNTDAVTVKQGDMLANIRMGNNPGKQKMYKEEYTAFRKRFRGLGNERLWDSLDKKLL